MAQKCETLVKNYNFGKRVAMACVKIKSNEALTHLVIASAYMKRPIFELP